MHRRSFLASAASLIVFQNDSTARAQAAAASASGRTAQAVAQDEDFWFNVREKRDGIVLKQVTFQIPPPSMDYLAKRIEEAITSRTKVIHICHMTNRTGQIFPVKQICRMGRDRGIEVIVDGAHAFAQFPFQQTDLDCDYFGTSLHKWLLAPIGTGMLHMKKSKIPRIWPMMGADDSLRRDIRKFEQIGTHPRRSATRSRKRSIFTRASAWNARRSGSGIYAGAGPTASANCRVSGFE